MTRIRQSDLGRSLGFGRVVPSAMSSPTDEQPELPEQPSVGSGLLGGWSAAGFGGVFGIETWREREARVEAHLWPDTEPAPKAEMKADMKAQMTAEVEAEANADVDADAGLTRRSWRRRSRSGS